MKVTEEAPLSLTRLSNPPKTLGRKSSSGEVAGLSSGTSADVIHERKGSESERLLSSHSVTGADPSNNNAALLRALNALPDDKRQEVVQGYIDGPTSDLAMALRVKHAELGTLSKNTFW